MVRRLLSLKSVFLLIILSLFVIDSTYAGQCKAITKKGTQCKRQAQAGSEYCWQHQSSQTKAVEEKALTKDTARTVTPSKESVKKENQTATRCQAITKKGTQCKRMAKPGSKFCWQHGG